MADAFGLEERALATTRDAFYGGRLVLEQPAIGHRSGTDAVLLAAAVPRDFDGLAYDVGAGVGAAGLGAALGALASRVVLVDRDPVTARLAAENVAANGLLAQASVVTCNLLDAGARRRALPEAAALVLTNPPYYGAGQTNVSPIALRRAAHVLDADATLTDWLRACLDLLVPKGVLVVIHTAAAVPEIVAACARGAGELKLKSIHPRAGAPARRVMVRAVKGSRAPFAIAPPLVLHGEAGFTDEAARLHAGDAALSW